MIDLSARSRDPEWMDDPGVDPQELRDCLQDLERVNRLTLGHRPVLRWLDAATRDMAAFTLLDVGFGNGDLLRAIAEWAARRRKAAALSGIDRSPASEAAARGCTPMGMRIDYRTGDVFAIDPGERYDFVVTSLMTHHLSEGELVAFLRWIDGAARVGWFNHDLQRSRIAYHGFRVMAAAARWHGMVRHDGAVSITRGFRRADWRRLLAEAGVEAKVSWRVPFKLCVSRLK